MAANRQIFKIKGDEFNLDFIELLHKSGEIRENDVIQIADKSGAPFQPFTLKFLEKRYGVEHPFRRGFKTGQIHNFSDSQDSDDSEEENNKDVIYVVNSTPSASEKQSANNLGKIDLIKKDITMRIKNRLTKCRRFPLIFDPKDASVDKLIRFSQGSALRKSFQTLYINTITHLDEFFAPLIEKSGYPKICTLCGVIQQPAMYSILTHIVSDHHYSNLRKCGYYETDYQFLVESLAFLNAKMKPDERNKNSDDLKVKNNKDVIYVNSTPSASGKQSFNNLGKIDLIKKDLGIKIKNRLLKYRRFPLIFDPKDKSVDKSKLKRFIHGSALKQVFSQIDQNTIKHLDGFFAPLIEKIGYPNSCTLCGIIQEPVMYSILTHILSDLHYSNLKKYGFFETDYQFLVESLEFLKTKMKAKQTKNKQKNAKKEKPLVERKVLSQNGPNIMTISSNIVEKPIVIDKSANVSNESTNLFPLIYDKNIKMSEKLLPFRHSEKLKLLFENFDEVTVNRKNGFFDVLFDVIGYPEKCELCSQKLFNDPYSVITHISSQKHVENLVKFGALSEDYGFWSKIVTELKDFYMKPQASSRSLCEIPLLYNPQQKYMGEKTTFKNGDAFRKTLKKLNADFIDLVLKKFFKNVGYPITCKLCAEPLEQKPSNVLYHLISPQHYMSLRNSGFYVRDYSFWINILQAISSNYCQVKGTNVPKFVNESKNAQVKKRAARRRGKKLKQQLANLSIG